MVITYFGGGSFRLQSGEISLLLDPPQGRLKGDVVVKTLVAAATPLASPHEISFPGEYEVKGLEIRGWDAKEESSDKFLKTVYRVEWESISFGFLGHLSLPLSAELAEKIGEPDVLFLPVGGGHFLSPEAAAKVVKQLEPRIVIPSFFNSPKEFLKAMGQSSAPQDKFVFKKKDLGNEVGKVVFLGAGA